MTTNLKKDFYKSLGLKNTANKHEIDAATNPYPQNITLTKTQKTE